MADKKEELQELLDDGDHGSIGARAGHWLWDLLKTWGPALLAVLVIRSVVAEPFRIPSGSMVPTLEIGDYIIVNKFAYGLRVPFTKVVVVPLDEPQAGDIVVFRYPADPSVDYIKRVVATPGDEVMVRRNVLYVNGERVEKKFVEDYTFIDDGCDASAASLYHEVFAEEETHTILYSRDKVSHLSEFGPFTVPPGEAFVMGDNRDNSSDSRAWGTVPLENIKGRAIVVWLSLDHCNGPKVGKLQLSLRLDRFGSVLH